MRGRDSKSKVVKASYMYMYKINPEDWSEEEPSLSPHQINVGQVEGPVHKELEFVLRLF